MSSLTDCKSAFCGSIVGRRRSGKTTLLFDLLRSVWKNRFDFIVIISPTMHIQENIWKRIDTTGIIIIPKIDQHFMGLLIEYQAEQRLLGCCKEILIALDDIGMAARTEDDSAHQDAITDLAFAGRQYNMSCVFLAQRYTQISPNYRSQMDFIAFFGSTNKRELTAIHSEWGDDDIQTFRRFISRELINENHTVLLFMNKNGKRIVTIKM